jgi:hypothetical protein
MMTARAPRALAARQLPRMLARQVPAQMRMCSAAASAPAPAAAPAAAPAPAAPAPAPAAKPADAPAADSKPSDSSSSGSSGSSSEKASFDSRDIAFKPNSDGWGYTKTYASGWDRIFAQKGGSEEAAAPTPAETAASTAAPTDPRLSALENALQVGAINTDLFERARQEGNY